MPVELNEKQKQVAMKAFDESEDDIRPSVLVAVAAVLALEPAGETERVAQLTAHRACVGTEHDPANGKLHGCCVVCGVPWPCEYAGKPPKQRPSPIAAEANDAAKCRHGARITERCYECYPTQPHPAQQDDAKLVEEMLDAYRYNSGWPDNLPPSNDMRKGMTAALAVVRKHYVAIEDVEKAIRSVWKKWIVNEVWTADNFIAAVKGDLTPRKVETPEARVKVWRMGASEHVMVYLDGVCVQQFDGEEEAEQHAERYKRGLIAELADAEKERGK